MKPHHFLTPLALVFSALSLAQGNLGAADSPVYELRIYTTNEGKLPDLLKRFREHTCKLFEKHGMTNIGYWVPVEKEDGADNTLIYIISHKSRDAAKESWAAFGKDPEWQAAAKASEANGKILAKKPDSIFMTRTAFSPEIKLGAGTGPRVFELRTYTTPEGKLPALHARFTNPEMSIFTRHGMTHIGYWQPTDEDKGHSNKMIYMLAHPSKEAGLKAFEAFRADPEWIKVKAESEKDGSLTLPKPDGVKSVYMQATDFSPIK
jgi:hypothetical protein